MISWRCPPIRHPKAGQTDFSKTYAHSCGSRRAAAFLCFFAGKGRRRGEKGRNNAFGGRCRRGGRPFMKADRKEDEGGWGRTCRESMHRTKEKAPFRAAGTESGALCMNKRRSAGLFRGFPGKHHQKAHQQQSAAYPQGAFSQPVGHVAPQPGAHGKYADDRKIGQGFVQKGFISGVQIGT